MSRSRPTFLRSDSAGIDHTGSRHPVGSFGCRPGASGPETPRSHPRVFQPVWSASIHKAGCGGAWRRPATTTPFALAGAVCGSSGRWVRMTRSHRAYTAARCGRYASRLAVQGAGRDVPRGWVGATALSCATYPLEGRGRRRTMTSTATLYLGERLWVT